MTITLYENFRAVFYTPFYAAHALGAYAEEGLDVYLSTSPDPAANTDALRSGAVDVSWGGPMRVMLDHERNPDSDIVCFCEVVAQDPFYILGPMPRPDFQL
jgi:NitT/TauT family transport system substrate-binding protein